MAAGTGAEARFVAPSAGARLTGGELVEVRWVSPCDASADEVELVLSADGGLTFPVRLTASMPPCASAFRWRVPSLPATRARLAVRSGMKDRPESERLALVSGEFAIHSTGAEWLIRGATEWRTVHAMTELCGGDLLLADHLTSEAPRINRLREEPDLDDPDSLSAPPPTLSRSGIPISGRPRPPLSPSPAPSRRAAPIPLRE